MSLLNRLRGGRAASTAEANQTQLPGQWQSLLIPAVDQPYSNRALEVAYRLAQGTNARVQLAYLIEVPRILPLDAALPEAEAVAANALHIAERAAIPYKVNVHSVIHRTRKAHDRILSLIPEENVDLLVLGARPDRTRGLPGDMARELFLAAPCEVIVDYIANEK
ncbi:MAG: universal stress protein [Armatimonadota bacterium]|nr:universal stress protein [Armatimonadota bacterium]